ncbi:hypothetical protein Ccrd_002990 [Cynara cardunculus var. scolymus]|uniref:Rho termination factor-like N-terminal domain-containing protein n=1 Tax=Cynara cardunculus var. scolymus TaxID=59895 RepID=A0A118JWC4_CYNCS|nr:hypothetical protein Ccrd_002990 [Cynara cardunculus var. scolymus]
MDDLWDPPNHPATEEINCRNDGCQCGLSLAYDEIEEKGLNEKSCIQVLRILISKADADIIELEEELMDLLSQLACTDEEFSNTLSMFLRVKIDILDLSIRKLKDDAGDFLSTSNTSIVESSNYQVHADSLFGEKKQMGSSSNVKQIKRVIITALEKHTISQTRVKIEEENANYPESTNNFGAPSLNNVHCMTPVSKYSALGLCQGSMEKINRELNKFQKESRTMTKDVLQNMTPRCNSVCKKPSLETQGKWKHQLKTIKCQLYKHTPALSCVLEDDIPCTAKLEVAYHIMTDDESIGSRSVSLEESSEAPNAKPNIIRESVFSLDNRDKSNSISLEARSRPDDSLVDREQNAPDTLLELSDHRLHTQDDSGPKRKQRFQTKLVSKHNVDDGNIEVVVKQERNDEEGDENSNLCPSVSSTKTYKRRHKLTSLLQTSSSAPGLLEGTKELSSLGIDVTSPHGRSEILGSLDMDYYTLDDLKAIAKQRKLKGYSKLRKSELAQVLGIKVMEGKRKQKRKEALPVSPTQGEP